MTTRHIPTANAWHQLTRAERLALIEARFQQRQINLRALAAADGNLDKAAHISCQSLASLRHWLTTEGYFRQAPPAHKAEKPPG